MEMYEFLRGKIILYWYSQNFKVRAPLIFYSIKNGIQSEPNYGINYETMTNIIGSKTIR